MNKYLKNTFKYLVLFICSVICYQYYMQQNTSKKIKQRIYKKTQTGLPDVVIIDSWLSGAPVLNMLLSQHPNIIINKDKQDDMVQNQLNKRDQLIHQVSSSYLKQPEICDPVKQVRFPAGVRFLVVVRNPVERALAHNKVNTDAGKESELFKDDNKLNEEAVILRGGCYYMLLSKWFKCYSKKKFLIIDDNELFINPEHVLQKVQRFLKIPEYTINMKITNYKRNRQVCIVTESGSEICKSEFPPDSDISVEMKQKLFDYYENKNKQFYKLVELTFNWNNNLQFNSRTLPPGGPFLIDKELLPKVMIIGAWRAGTGALNLFLSNHPQIAGVRYEINYFTANSDKSDQWFINHLKKPKNGQIVLECSASYFYSPHKVCHRIKGMGYSQDTKFIFVVREPVSRAISHYTMNEKNVKLNKLRRGAPNDKLLDDYNNLNERNNVIKAGDYYLHLTNWYKCFPKEQFLVVDGDKFRINPVTEINKVQKFLEISDATDTMKFTKGKSGEFCVQGKSEGKTECRPDTARNKYRNVPHSVKKLLFEYYQPKNELFYKLVGHRFDWNNQTYL